MTHLKGWPGSQHLGDLGLFKEKTEVRIFDTTSFTFAMLAATFIGFLQHPAGPIPLQAGYQFQLLILNVSTIRLMSILLFLPKE